MARDVWELLGRREGDSFLVLGWDCMRKINKRTDRIRRTAGAIRAAMAIGEITSDINSPFGWILPRFGRGER